MRKFVKYQPRKINIITTQHGIEHRVGESAQCAVRGDAAYIDIRAIGSQPIGKLGGAWLTKIATIGNAAHKQKTPHLRIDGEFRRGEYVPDYVGPLKVGIAAIAAIVRQAELGGSEATYLTEGDQPGAQTSGGVGIFQQFLDIHAPGQQVHLATHRLQVVARARASGHRDNQRQAHYKHDESHAAQDNTLPARDRC